MKWKLLKRTFDEQVNWGLQQQHHAVQLIALSGKYLLDEKADDSHTNMIYVSEKDVFMGHALSNGLHVALSLNNLYLQLIDENYKVIKQFALEGKTRAKSFDMLKKMLADTGIDVSALKNELHYEIPPYAFSEEAVFSFDDVDGFEANAIYRYNAIVLLNEVIKNLSKADEIRVWPHHFDSGCFIPLANNAKGDLSQYIGLGLAIPDSMIDEPYFYLSFWSEKAVKELKNLETLPIGNWMMPNWNGAVLKLSEILDLKSAKDQYQLALDFYKSGLKSLSKYLDIK